MAAAVTMLSFLQEISKGITEGSKRETRDGEYM